MVSRKSPNVSQSPNVVTRAPYELRILQDDTDTSVRVVGSGVVVGEGHARRRKGDKRNKALGLRLARARAFQDAADRLFKQISEEYGDDHA